MANPHQPLIDALVAKLRVIHPTADPHDSLTSARLVAACGAFAHDGERIVPVGTEEQLRRARQEAPQLVDLLSREYVASVTSDNPLDRADARLRTLGSSLAAAFGAGAPVFPRDDERARVALSSPDPLTRAQARLHLMGIEDDTIGPFNGGEAA